MAHHHILLIGGHGKIAQLLTPLLLAKSWNVTSMIRTSSQQPAIEKLGQGQPGKLSVLVRSVSDVKSEADAQGILQEVRPDWVVWSAGAGGKGGPEMTYAVDRDAAIAFTRASIASPSIKKFLTISYLSSRRGRAPWWTDEDWTAACKVNKEVLPDYYKAKVAADEVLTVLAKDRVAQEEKAGVREKERFCGVSLRPGTLTDEAKGKVEVGRLGARGKTSRGSVADVVVGVLEMEGVRGWVDVVDGGVGVGEALRRYVVEGLDAVEGEDEKGMRRRVEEGK
ncbi:nad dependent epimerase dehydratase [Pyrenophora seminiperda CCB06]|uniref:Nad dependent epimerase dehydratase n=1 Tax=Pyrenophora seminiperda CCB06 TaxID=1302712 RepID=A0A3M7MDH8_9PLEO|nr:nad dependent epimerase dehydratase [Pyrenophora seminiperda CCB06]